MIDCSIVLEGAVSLENFRALQNTTMILPIKVYHQLVDKMFRAVIYYTLLNVGIRKK